MKGEREAAKWAGIDRSGLIVGLLKLLHFNLDREVYKVSETPKDAHFSHDVTSEPLPLPPSFFSLPPH